MTKTVTAALVVMSMLFASTLRAEHHEGERAAIDTVLDGFHDAAANADAERYLGYLTDEAVFMGTDEWDRWPKHPDFTDYVAARFADGGWSYRSVERQVQIADDVAWFDEVVYSETNGRFRGTGVLVKADGNWKIAHYAMSFLVFNENWQDVIELTRRTRAEKAQN